MLVAGLAFGGVEHGSDAPQPESKVVSIDPAGAEVELLLLTKLEAGQAKKGDEVPFLVAETCLTLRAMAIERGAVESALSKLVAERRDPFFHAQPARARLSSVAIRPLALENGLSARGLASRSDDESDTIIEFTSAKHTPKKLNSEDRIDTGRGVLLSLPKRSRAGVERRGIDRGDDRGGQGPTQG